MNRPRAGHGREPPVISSIESTLPPTSREDLLAAGGTVLVFSHDAALASVIKSVAEGRYPWRVINEWRDLIRLIRSDVGRIVLLDVDALAQPVEKALAELHQSADWLVVVIAAKQQEAQDFMRFWSERRIHRLLIKPAAVGITRLLLESAVARYVELREVHEETDSLEIPPDLRKYATERRSTPWRKLLAAVLLVAVGAGLYLTGRLPFLERADGPGEIGVSRDVGASDSASTPSAAAREDPPAGAPASVAEPAARRSTVPTAETPPRDEAAAREEAAARDQAASRSEPALRTETTARNDAVPPGGAAPRDAALPTGGPATEPERLDVTPPVAETPQLAESREATPSPPPDPFRERLAAAARAERANRLVEPFGDNALDGYVAILRAAPDHAGARAGLDALLERLYMQAEAQFLENDLGAAEQTLAHIRRADPASTRLRFLTEQLTQARATAEALAAAEAAAAEAAAEAAAARTAPRAAPVEPPAQPASTANAELASMLTLVARRIEQQQLVAPAGDSARDYLQRAISVNPNDNGVVDAVGRLYTALTAAAPAAFAAGELDRAEALVATALELGPVTLELDDLRAAITAAHAEHSEQTLAALAARATARLEQGRLVGDDSAVALVAELRRVDPSHPAIPDLETRLRAVMAAAARTAINAASWTQADALVAAFDAAALDSRVAAGLRRELDEARRQATYLAEASPIGELELLRTSEAEYPREALQRGTTGWVELHFTVDREGATRDIVVVEAEPSNVFDQAAIAAIGRYRFVPFELGGATYERRARVRLRFVVN